ncbi:uncharacterized protein LOC107273949 isoform X2 [Cephus cinctus]|uniref:Uncharacterized protein LOC107273949 isoform X2 n=1 Tax=Cephus cinctus TaxID=211228 RepID=A0AAJ7CDG1_CEPCN|nr:uncharacterized protein LOC107273949 isoform X2 [Cephus cinctus]
MTVEWEYKIKNIIMDLREDIKRATKINPSHNSNWHVKSRSQTKNSRPNEKRFTNVNFEPDEDPSNHYSSISKIFTCQDEVISNVIEVNGGIDYSNESIEQHLRFRQLQKLNTVNVNDMKYLEESTSMNYDIPSYDTSTSDIDLNNINIIEDNSCSVKPENEQTGIQMFSRNALISGLIKNEVIRVEDLYIENTIAKENSPIESNSQCESVSDDSRCLSCKDDTTSESESLVDYNSPLLVPHPNEPDFFGHPLQIFGKMEEQGIDFTIPSAGVKKTVTPRQFFMNIPESTFAFVSKKKIDKSS